MSPLPPPRPPKPPKPEGSENQRAPAPDNEAEDQLDDEPKNK